MLEIDVCFAKANYAYKTKSAMPVLNDKGIIELSKARHPLINADSVVPIDIRLGKDFSTLVITGPNTGGKTVALKTLGLLTLMTMCGLMVPASDGSKISVFDGVFADIGDEQSIDQSLSTFSSHMVNIVEILNSVSKNSLVLLDEIGAGTDPVEGAALAVSILEKFKKIGAKIAATTHYAEMKIYALENEGVENASCEFDISTLKPTYKLMIGVPGKSNAFAISKKLGISDEIIENAKNLISSEDTRFEDVIEKLEEKGKQLEKEKVELQRLILDNKKSKEEINKLNEQVALKAEEQIEEARNEAKKLVLDVTEKANQLFSELEELRKQKNKKDFAKKIHQEHDIFFLGRGVDYPVAMEASLKLKEISYIHSDAYAAGELKHGPIALIEDGITVIAILTDPFLVEKSISNIQEVITRGAKTLIVTNQKLKKLNFDLVFNIPETNPLISPILSVIPLQLLSYYVSKEKGLDVDKPRNLAKSVTVE